MAMRRLGATHQCNLIKGSDSCLPKLPPKANRVKKRMREFRKSIMVSSGNSNSKFFFRSRAAIFTERKRHFRSMYTYIIHPFSNFSTKREIFMCVLWMITFFKDPFLSAYYRIGRRQTYNWWSTADAVIDFMMLINVFLCFCTGIHRAQTKEVILEPSKIACHYVKTYFFFDFFGTIPVAHLVGIYVEPYNDQQVYFTLASCLHFFRFVRIKTMLEYFRRITEMFGCEDASHQVFCLILLSFICIHWCACLIYIVPKLHYGFTGSLSEESWLKQAGIYPGLTNWTVSNTYLECLLSGFCHFYRAGYGMYITEDPLEQVTFSIIMVAGVFFTSYVLAVILQMVNSASASESKYEELVNQLEQFMMKKKLPYDIRQRILLYYENRFQKHYFKEQFIMNTLSDHLKYEIFLHSCKSLVEKVELFQGLSKSTIGSVVACLKYEVFLPNDIITKKGSLANSIYFISFGTVAHILPSGREIRHLEDGEHFGEMAVYIPQLNKRLFGHYIAIEITEVFRLPEKDLQYQDEEIGERFEKIATEKWAYIQSLANEEGLDESKPRRDVLYELRKGHILEHGLHKRRQ